MSAFDIHAGPRPLSRALRHDVPCPRRRPPRLGAAWAEQRLGDPRPHPPSVAAPSCGILPRRLRARCHRRHCAALGFDRRTRFRRKHARPHLRARPRRFGRRRRDRTLEERHGEPSCALCLRGGTSMRRSHRDHPGAALDALEEARIAAPLSRLPLATGRMLPCQRAGLPSTTRRRARCSFIQSSSTKSCARSRVVAVGAPLRVYPTNIATCRSPGVSWRESRGHRDEATVRRLRDRPRARPSFAADAQLARIYDAAVSAHEDTRALPSDLPNGDAERLAAGRNAAVTIGRLSCTPISARLRSNARRPRTSPELWF